MKYTVAVFAVLFNERHEFLALKFADDHFGGKWTLPAGRLEQHETWKAGLLREIREETGLDERQVTIRDPIFVDTWTVGDEPFLGVMFWGTVATTRVVLSHEHAEFKWLHSDQCSSIDPAYTTYQEIVTAAYTRLQQSKEET